jgi:hypothetical protein
MTVAATAAFAGNARSSAQECSEQHVHLGNGRTYVKQEVIDGSRLRSVKATTKNAPISVEGGSSGGYQITVCKAAETLADLDAIRVVLDGDELKATGPDDRRWMAMYHIQTPRGAEVDVTAQNGPLSLKNVDGNVKAVTTNGPISVSGGSGTMNVTASNGPLSVTLDGASFNGSLDASTKNGPLTVTVPRNYGSGIVVESNGHGPISCRAEGCNRGWRSDDDGEPRRIELGSGNANVHLSTVNGPVTIKDE